MGRPLTPMREERKIVTALFADVVGSTELGERLDPEDARDIVGEAVRRMAQAVEDFGGTIKDLAGDGVLALFGAPVAHEDDAERAVRAGLRIVGDIDAYAGDVARDWSVEGFSVRVGIESGMVVLGPVDAGTRVEYGATGDAINTASRLQSHAEPGTVIVGEVTQRPIEPLFEWGEPRELRLKGKAEPVVAFTAKAARARARTSPLSDKRQPPLVGRDEELDGARAVLRSLLEGRGAILFVTGEPGIGKSRLLAELQEQAEAHGVRWLEGRCVSYGGSTPYLPFQDLLREWLAVGAESSAAEVAAALAGRTSTLLGDEAASLLPYLLAMLGSLPEGDERTVVETLSPEAFQFRTLDALRTLLARLARDAPLVVAIEDLHWSDASSIRVIEALLPLAAQGAVLLIVTQRIEPDHASHSLRGEATRSLPDRTFAVDLDALPEGVARELLAALIGKDVLPAGLELRIFDASEGNPFFLEELVHSLIDAGALVPADGGWRFDHHIEFEVPTRVDKVIVARIDRLDAGCRDVLTAASVLGRRFSVLVLTEVVGGNGEVAHALSELTRLDLLRRDALAPEYAFKHALIQEAAYRNLLKKHRRELHLRAATVLQSLYPDQLEDNYPVLAFHYRGAGDLDAALRCHRSAAQTAMRVSALPEALQHLDAAMAIATELGLPLGDPTPVDLRLLRGTVRARTGEFAGAREDLERALEGARASSIADAEMRALNELGFLLAGASDYRQAVPLLEEALGKAKEMGDRRSEALILSRLSIVHTNLLDLDLALREGRHALDLASQGGDEGAVASALDAIEVASVMVGDFETVDEVAPRLADIHRKRGDLWYLQYAIFQWCWGPIARGEWDVALRRLDEAQEIAHRIGDRGPEPMYDAVRCWLHRSRGEYRLALETGRRSVTLADDLGHTEWQTWTRSQLSRALLEVGAVEEAADVVEKGLETAGRSGSWIQLVRSSGLLALARWRLGEVQQALDLAGRTEEMLSGVTAPPGMAYLQGADAPIAVAEVLAGLGELDRAERLVRRVLSPAERCGWHEVVAGANLLLATCGEALGDLPGASLAAGLALRAAADIPGTAWRAHATLARLRRAEGRNDEAETHAAEARSVSDGLCAGIDDDSIRQSFTAVVGSELEGSRRDG